jgi:ABC-type transport system involved in cytochrome c biogenesis ATPase subunit
MPAARRTARTSGPSTRQRKQRETPPPFGRLLRYEVKGLFGKHDHAFDLELDGPTILTGANGTGKSTILRTINAVGSGAWDDLALMPFRALTLRFEDAPLVRVSRVKSGLKVEHGSESFTLDPSMLRFGTFRGDPRQLALWRDAEHIANRERYIEYERRVRERAAYEAAMRSGRVPEEDWGAPEWFFQIAERFSVRFVTDQRLVLYGDESRPPGARERGEDVRHAASEYAKDLRRQMSLELAGYAAASQRHDRGFPKLVVDAMSAPARIDIRELRELLETVALRREALERVGLLETGVEDEPQFEPSSSSLEHENVSPVIKTFAEVTLRKFDTLEPFRRRLKLFVDFLDQRFVDKHAITTDELGLMFELTGGALVRPAQLSSGEQQMLVLAYQLLFETSPSTLLLIDEPEISLHVGWQTSFVDDIALMGRDRNLQFLLASHSPVLIGGREELKRSLDTPRR